MAFQRMMAFFHRQITGIGALVVGMNGVEVGCFYDFNVHTGVLGGINSGKVDLRPTAQQQHGWSHSSWSPSTMSPP